MTAEHHIVLDGAPAKTSGYLRSVLLPRRGVRPGDAASRIRLTHPGLRIDAEHVAGFRRLCRWEPSDHLPFLYPLTLLFHYHLGIFAHPAFPCSLRDLLGLRNHVVQRRRIAPGEPLDLEAHTVGQRVLAKGVEFDFRSVFSRRGEPVWEAVHVYYLRGEFGGTDSRPDAGSFEPLERVDFETAWEGPAGNRWRFARLTGDFNPLHYSAPVARTAGYRRDFSHTQRMVAECLQRLPEPPEAMSESLRLDVAFKGPVYYGSPLLLKGARQAGGYRFDLYCGEADKPAIPGSLQRVPPDEILAPS